MKTILFTLAILTAFASANAVEYNPAIAGEKVNITGGSVTGMAINARMLRLKKGQTGEKQEQEFSANSKTRESRNEKSVTTLTKKET